MKLLRILLITLLFCGISWFFVAKAWAFCGFYVAKADSKLYNQASQVAIARNGNRNVLTMANDYQGEVKDFAIVVPVPVVLQENQVQVVEPTIMERLDAFSAPRLVEYFDPDPCTPMWQSEDSGMAPRSAPMASAASPQSNRALGVTVESQFTVGEYEIVILSAKESGGLETWLTQNGYRIPAGTRPLLQPYIRQRLKFFVAKVNLQEYEASGYRSLRPLKISFESPRFMLPIRLGMTNAQAAQDLIVYIMSPQGQAEVTNYRTVKVPSDAEVPLFVKDKFSDFYKATFATAYDREGRNVAFLEYAWDMAGCDPCSAEPLTPDELKQAGAFWVASDQPTNVFLTRLHVRYTRDRFPEDLMFQTTNNRESFQGRYILRHLFTGQPTCRSGWDYQRSLPRILEQQAQTLTRLTGWNLRNIREQLPQMQSYVLPWWQKLWQALSLGW